MGKYLGIGFVTKVVIDKENAIKMLSGDDAAKDYLGKRYNPTGLYDFTDNGRDYIFTLKRDIIRREWIDALKTAVYILNRVPTKAVSKTPFELFKGWKPSLHHVRVWGCPSEVRVYNPQEKKLDPRTISGFFIGYPEGSKGYMFYCPSHTTRIVES